MKNDTMHKGAIVVVKADKPLEIGRQIVVDTQRDVIYKYWTGHVQSWENGEAVVEIWETIIGWTFGLFTPFPMLKVLSE